MTGDVDAAGSTVALQHKGPGFKPLPGALKHGVCMFSAASSNNTKYMTVTLIIVTKGLNKKRSTFSANYVIFFVRSNKV